jgi:3-oxoacyl-(acyl-carrier-protein) synthase
MLQFPADQRDIQIPKKGDQRQMEAWQRIGTYAAGLALDSAGIKGDKEILGSDRQRRKAVNLCGSAFQPSLN